MYETSDCAFICRQNYCGFFTWSKFQLGSFVLLVDVHGTRKGCLGGMFCWIFLIPSLFYWISSNWMLIQLPLLKTESPRPTDSDLTAGDCSVWSYRHAQFWLPIMMLWIIISQMPLFWVFLLITLSLSERLLLFL